jgi:hypothetical protein
MHTNQNVNGRRRGFFGDTVTAESFDQFKKEALEIRLARHEVLLSDIRVLSDTKLLYAGVNYPMTDEAFGSLVKLLGVNKTVLGNFEGALGKEGRDRILDLMREALSGKGGKNKITMVLNRDKQCIVDFRKDALSVLSNSAYFNLFEDVMNHNNGMHIKRMSMSPNGSVEISVINDNWQFQVARLKDEFFQSGLVFINRPNQTIINSFNERLVCTNGMVVSEGGASITLKSSSSVHLNGFFEQVRNITQNDGLENEFKNRVTRMMKTIASYNEMHAAYTTVKYHLSVEDTGVVELLNSFIPMQEVRREYIVQTGLDIEDHSKYWKKAETSMTVWELVNGLTDISSHPEKYGISLKGGNHAIFSLQKTAGELAFKKEYDLEMEMPRIFDTKTRINKDFEGETESGIVY